MLSVVMGALSVKKTAETLELKWHRTIDADGQKLIRGFTGFPSRILLRLFLSILFGMPVVTITTAQILTFEFSSLAGDEATADSNSNDANLETSTISRGAGLTASVNSGRFNATSWALTSIANAVSGNDYMEFTITPSSGYQFGVTSIVIQLQRSGTGNRGLALRYSLDSYASNLDSEKSVVDSTSTQTFTWNFTQSNSSSPVTYRLYSWAEATGGSGGPGDGSGNDISVYGSVSTASAPDLDVRGNNAVISDGDTSPVVTDHTDFGAVGLNQSNLVRTFSITNTGSGSLTLENVAVGGANAADFTVTAQPTLSLAAGASTTFQVRFDPSATGERNAILYVTNNVTGKNPYDFYIRGTSVAATIVRGPSSINVTTMVGSSPANAGFGVTNGGRGRLDYAISTNVNWLSVSPVSAQLAETANQQHTVTISAAGLSAGVSNATITITDANADNSPQTVTVALTLTNIPDPTAHSATVDGKELIDLAWTKRTDHDVMIVYREGAAPTAPTPGVSYSVGNSVGGGMVIYKGSGSTLEHVVSPNASHYYRFYSINNNHYSPGVQANVSTEGYGAGEIVDQLGYTNGVNLSGLNGGNGWTNAWSDDNPGAYTISSISFTTQTNYPATAANKILVTPPNDVGRQAYRYFNGYTSGKVYAGYMINIQYNGPNKYSGMSFMQGSTEKMFFGEVYGADQKLGIGGTTSGTNLLTGGGNDYIVIARYDFGTDVGSVVAYKIGTDYVPSTEPGVWHATYTDSSLTRIDGIRLASGAGGGSGTPGNTYFDEVRVSTNWSELLRMITAPEIAVLGTNGALISSGNIVPSGADGTDFRSVNVIGSTSLTNIFSITNSGNVALTITGVTTSSAMGAAADFTVLSWPGSIDPGTSSNLAIRFNPSTLGVRTALVTIANSDADEGTYEFALSGTGTGVYATVVSQGFEGSTNDNWNYTFSSGLDYVYVDGGTNASGSYALTLAGSDSLNVDPYVEFDNIDISGFMNVTLQVAFAVAGADNNDNLHLDVSYDNGATWAGPGSTTLVFGASNTNLGFTGIGSSTVGSNPWYVALPSTGTQVKIRIRFDESVNANTFDRYFFDEVKLTAAGEKPRVSFGGAAYWVRETNTSVTVPVSISSSADATVRVALAGTAIVGGANDYTVNSTNIIFVAGGATTSNLVLTMVNDTLPEGLEDIQLRLVKGQGVIPGGPGVASVLIQDDETFSLMTANLTAGTNIVDGTFAYDESAMRIIKRLRPDVLAIQEWKITNASYRAFVDEVLGPEYEFYLEPEGDANPIPNGVISRYPIVASNEWTDSYVGSRDHVHVRIDLPGPKDLNLVSVHFKAGAPDAATRLNEARELTNYIANAGFSAGHYLAIAGDLNITGRTETTFLVLTQIVTDAHQPADKNFDVNSNLGRGSPYDHVLPNELLDDDHVELNFDGFAYTNGMIFDSRQFADHLLPALVEDSFTTNRTHLAVMKLFNLSTAAVPPTVVTTIASATNATTATSGGNVTADGGATVTNRGVVWSTSANPTVPGIQSTNGTGTGSFSSTLTNLTPGQTYFYRAFAQNSAGTGYGTEYSLTTPCFTDAPAGLYASLTNDVNFTATWTAVAGATGYALDVSTNATFGGSGGAPEAVIYTENFETDGSGSRYSISNAFLSGTADHFNRVQASDISGSYTLGTNGTYFIAGEDIDDNGGGTEGVVQIFTKDISGYTNIIITAAFAAPRVNTYDSAGDFMKVYASIDGGSFTLVGAFENDGTTFNSALYQDTNLDGTGEGTQLTGTLTDFSFNTGLSGTGIVVRFVMDNNSGDEEMAFDNIRIVGQSAAGSPDYVPGYSNRAVAATSQSVTGLTTGVTYYFRVRATNDFCITGNSSTATVTTILITPGIEIRGNNLVITNGDNSPVISDHTDFGAVGLVGSNLVRTFTITNNGTSSLTFDNVAVGGTDPADFTVTAQPSSPVGVGATTTFQVRFDPTAVGTRTATLYLTNNVAAKNPYTFDVQGTGVAASVVIGPAAINLTTMVGTTPSSAGFGVTNGGRGQLVYSITTNVNWLSVSPAAGTVSEFGNQQHTITFSANGLYAGASNATITITDANALYSPQTVTVTLTLTNIPDPTAQSAVVDGYEMINLAWTKRASHDVMIVYRQGAASTAPDQGVSYALGDAVGGGGVIYKGSGASLEHIVAPGNDHYYAFYSINNNHYSPGVTFFTNTGSYALSEIVDVFAYTNGVSFSSAPTENGGNGWTSAWSVGAGTWNADSGSMDVNTNYPDEVANSLKLTNPGNGQLGFVTRAITPFTNGYLYASTIVRFQYNGGNKYAGIELTSNGNAKAFFGEIRDQDLRPGVAPSATSSAWNYDGSYGMNDYNSNTGNVYMIVGRYNFSTRQFDMAVFYKTTAIPALEPGTWNATTTLAAGTMNSVDGIRLVAGSSDGGATLGDAFFDEVRVADSWAELIGQFPEPEIAVLGTNYAVIADGETAASTAKGSDFGSTLVAGGQVDRTLFITNSGAGLLNISGVTTSGAHASDFVILDYPIAVYPGTVSNFVIRFDPSAAGSRTATVVVASDDSDEASYDFVVQGTGQVPPTVTTTVANPTNETSATSGGDVTDEGFAAVTNRGVVWSTAAGPTVPGTQSSDGTGSGSYVSSLTGLAPGETYYYRAFAQNSAGTSYGAEYNLTTPCFAGVVTGLYVSVTNDVNFTAVWSNLTGATGYELDVSTETNFSIFSSGNYGVEVFTNMGGGTVSSYLTRQWTNNGVGWTAFQARTDQTIDGSEAVTLQNASGSFLVSDTISGGIDRLWVTHQLKFTGADSFDIFVNGIKVATNVVYSATVQTAVVENIAISGSFTIMITNKSGGRVALDNLTWTNTGGSVGSYVAGYEGRAVSGLSHMVTGLTQGVTYYYRVRATNQYCQTGDSVTGSVTTLILAPSIDIFGNGTLISDGDTTPNPADHTDFGTVGLINSNLVRTFTITNAGPGTLLVYNVTTSGAAASDFTVVSAPASSVLIGQTTSFQVRFDPSAIGTRTATISVSNNVAGKTIYDFVVQGTGVASGIYVSPTNINVSSMVGSAPSAESFGVTNVGLGELVYLVSSNVRWLSISPVSGTNSETAGRQHTVTFSVNGFGPGVSNGTITVTSATASNSPVEIPVTLTLTAIPDALAATVTNDGNEMVRLHWTKHASYDVLITHRQTNAPGAPVQGTSYSVNGTIGSDGTRVIYSGSGTNLEHVVAAGSINHYTFYSINNNHYSTGLQTNTVMGTYAVGEVVETFSYTNATMLAGRGGGQGFSGNWLGDTNRFTNILYSFSSQDLYPTNRANKVVTTPSDATTNIVRRALGSSYGSGVIYVGYILNYQYNGPDKFSGLSLMSNTTEKLFVGEVGNADQRLGLDGTSASEVLTAGTGNDYIIILRYSWASGTADALAYKIGTDSVPETEPGTWDVTLSKASNVVGTINGIRLASGAGAGTPGQTYFDEIRVATSWQDLLRIAPSKVIYDWFADSSGTVSGDNGGTGWSNTWTFGGDAFIDFTSTSIPKEKSSYHEPQGNKIVMYGDVDDRDMTLSRNFLTPFTTGVVYFSWMQNYEFSGISKHAGLSLMDGTNEKAFIGKVSDGGYDKRFGIYTSTDNRVSNSNLEPGTGNDYVIIGKYDFSTRELSATFYKTTEESIAEEPQGYWFVSTTQTVGHITNLSGIRFAIGAGAGTQIGDVYMDEIRVGTNFYEVARRDGESQSQAMAAGPVPKLLYIGTNYVPATNPQGALANITVTDADLINDSEPLDIAVLWTNAHGVFLTNSTASITNIGSRAGRVNPNWDPVVLSGSELLSIGYDGIFTNYSGRNGSLAITSYVHGAFSITNSTLNDTYFITMSAENNNLNGGTFAAHNAGDQIPYWRALTVNTALQFFVQDDDPVEPEFFEFTINGDGGFGDTNLTAGAIAIIAVNGAPSTDDERFSFVVLRPFPAGTTIQFTDRGWDPGSNTWHRPTEFHTNEWVSPGNATVGQVIELTLDDINNSGDQVVVYQYNGSGEADTDPDNVNFLYAVNLDPDNDGWDVNPIPNDNEHSGIYRGLTNSQTAVSVPINGYRVNAYYTGTVVGTASDLLLSISDSNNWYVVPSASSTNLNITNYNFTVTGSGTIDWTLATLSDEQVLTGGYAITNVARDDYSGLVASNTSFANAPYFVLYNTNASAAVSNYFNVEFANGAVGIQTMVMSAPPGSYSDITIGTVSSLVYVSDMDSDRVNDHLDRRFSMPVFVYDDDAATPEIGTNLVTIMLGDTALNTTNRLERLVAWNFNDGDTVADHGSGIFTNNLSGSISYANSGTTINAVTNDVAGNDITISGTANIGRYLQFTVDMTGHKDLMLTMAAQRSAAGYDSNVISYAVNGGAPVIFQNTWTPASSFALASFDFSAVEALNNATSVSIFITFGTNSATGGGNNRFDNIQVSANVIRYYEITDATLALVDGSSPLKFSFNAFDSYSGVARGTADTGTNMFINIDGFTTNNTANFVSGDSSATSSGDGSTSVWVFADAISYERRGDLFANGESNRSMLATFADIDNDRLADTLWSSNSFFGKFRIIDDDPDAPALRGISFGGVTGNNRPFYVATNFIVADSSELIRGNYNRRAGTGSTSVFAVTDAELALSGTLNMQFVFGAIDAASAINRGTSGSTNTVMSISIGNAVTGNVANFNAGISSASGGPGVTESNIWTFANGFFTDEMINSMMAASSNRVAVTIPDNDNDRTNDNATLYNETAGWLQVYDDDVSGPTMGLVNVPESPGGNTILATSFETTQGWPSSVSGYSAGTNWNVTDVYGTWYGSGAFYTTLNNKNTGTRRIGLLVNTNAPSLQWLQLPPVDNPGALTFYAARFSGADVTVRVERADGGSWFSVGEITITNLESVAFQPYSFEVDYVGSDVTLRVVRAGSTGAQVSIDDLAISSTATWISTNSLTINWEHAVDDFSGVDEYRIVPPGLGTTAPTGTNSGSYLSPAITSSVQSILGQQGVITGFLFSVDNDSDRQGDRAMGNIVSVVVRVDTNPPPAVADFAGSNDIGDVTDTTSEIKLTWVPKATVAEAAGWRQSDSEPLSPFVSYRVYYTENTLADPTYSDAYFDATNSVYSDLGTYSTTEIVIDGLVAGYEYRLAMAGIDEAGNVGPLSDVAIVTLDIFGITTAFASEESYTVIQWEGRDDGAYDVIYADSTGYTAQVDTMWKLAETVIGTQFVDQGGADVGSNNERVAPGDLPAKWMRFYRVAPVNAWIPAESRPGAASEEVVVAHQIALAASNNFIGISMSPMVHSLAEFLGTNRLPAGLSSDESTRINLYAVNQTGDPEDNTLWLSVTGWLDHANGWANTNELPYPHEGFDIYVPYATNLLMVGRVPWTNTPTIQISTQSYHVLSMNLPRPTKVSDLGIRDLLTPGMNLSEADEVRIMTKGTAPWGQPRGRMYVWTNGLFRFANNGSAENFVIEADEAVIIYSKALAAPVLVDWAGTNYYPKPTVLISTAITAAPTVKAFSAIVLNGTNALLRGSVNPNSLVSETWFQYGLTTNYGITLSSINLPATNAVINVSSNIYGLIEGARYYFQLVSSNAMGLSRFGTGSFLIGGGPDNMVYVPDYTFMMGATTNVGHESNASELPQHAVTINAFFMDKYEVTASMWSNVYEWAITNDYGFNFDGTGKDSDHPIVDVSWYDAVKWCNARSEMEGRTPVYYNSTSFTLTNAYKSAQVDIQNDWVDWTADGYRLPTEAEWERAARAGVGDTRFPWTDYTNNISHAKANFDNDGGEGYQVGTTGNHPTYGVGGFPYTSPVGSFGANAAGLYDMAGNVRELCWDWYDAGYYSSSPGSDPRGPVSGTYRVNRSSGWDVNAAGSRIAARHGTVLPSQASNNRGFRTVISAP